MSTALVQVQLPPSDPLGGFWGPSLLAHDLFPFPEASCTGFFVAGLAWGVRKGILEVRLPYLQETVLSYMLRMHTLRLRSTPQVV